MEEVLEVYQRPHDPARPQVCLEEAAKQLLGRGARPFAHAPRLSRAAGSSAYSRQGTASMFMVFEPLAGRRHVFVRDQRSRLDFAAVIKTLVDELYPAAEKIVLVLDGLNTRGIASLYAGYPAAEARRLAERLEVHHTPRHGSWLNMAELERFRAGAPVLGRTHGKSGTAGERNRCLGTHAQRRGRAGELALHHRRRSHQAPPLISLNTRVMSY
jgi:DDE superfamily endonuclease